MHCLCQGPSRRRFKSHGCLGLSTSGLTRSSSSKTTPICIIQDDPDAWMAEVARMSNVYSTAKLVLAANAMELLHTTDFRAGLPDLRVSERILRGVGAGCKVGRRSGRSRIPLAKPIHVTRYHRTSNGAFHSAVFEASGYRPLDMRGWTCQESLLGRRSRSLGVYRLVTSWHPASADSIKCWRTRYRTKRKGRV